MILDAFSVATWLRTLEHLNGIVLLEKENADRTHHAEEFGLFTESLEKSIATCKELHVRLVNSGYFDAIFEAGQLSPELNEAQREICAKIRAGKTNKEIAQDLNLGQQTVKNYLTRIYRHYGAKNRLELATILIGQKK